jgi:chromosome segregation protein
MKRLESVKLIQFLLYEQQEFGLDEITGIFGRNGSGKSSALDAVQIAMFGANKNLLAFNAQADSGARHQNRTLRSYCLGQFGDDSDQCARAQAMTYITLVWRDTETNEPISMGVCIEASVDSEGDRVLGRYVIRGVELAMSEHLQTVNGVTAPLPWNSFRHRLVERSKVTGEDPLFDDASTYVKQVLFVLRGNAGQASYEAFARAFRFALRMRFDKSVDQIVRQDVLEDRPTNIQKFKSIVETFKRLNAKIAWVEEKVKRGQAVASSYRSALTEARRGGTRRALEAGARHESNNAQHEALALELGQAEEQARGLRDKSTEAQQHLVSMRKQVAHLEALQQAHVDHQQNAQAQQAREAAESRATARGGEFEAELKSLVRMVRNACADESIATWRNELEACEVRLQKALGTADAPDLEFLQRAMRDLGVVATQAAQALDASQLEFTNRAAEAGKQVKVIEAALERAQTGRARLSDSTQYLINELKEQGLDPTPVCDLVRVTDTKWQPAIEAYLASNVEALLVRESEEDEAFEVYRGLQGKRAIYGVKIVRASRMRSPATAPADSVAALIEGKNQHAVAYLRGKLGNLKRAENSAEALRGERTLTVDGMLVGPGDFERLELVHASRLRIGAGDMSQVGILRDDLKRLRLLAQESMERAQRVALLRTSLQSMAAPETARLIESQCRTLQEVLRDREVARQRLEGSTSSEYQKMCAELSESKAAVPGLENADRQAHGAAERAEAALGGFRDQLKQSSEALAASAEVQERCRADMDYDAAYASDHWDKLLERFGEDYPGMAGHCRTLGDQCTNSMVRHTNMAQNLLGAYLSEYREALDDEASADWRQAKEWIEQEIARLESTELAAYRQEAQEAYEASQRTFRQDVALALNSNLKLLHDTFDRFNKALKSTPAFTNGERYQFIYRVRPALEPLLKFVKNVSDFGSDGNLFGDPGSIPVQFEELLRDKTSVGNAAVKSPLDDYREFYEFDIRIDCEDPQTGVSKTVGHLSKRIGPGSGGEHRAPLYVIAGAALYSAYRMDKNNRDGLRLILLDEAFDKMDAPNIVATMRYLQELGLQVLMASPGENLATLTAFLNRYFEIQKDPDLHVIEVQERRVSEAMRLQFREDLWEFHPELLEQELERVRREVVAPAIRAPLPAA